MRKKSWASEKLLFRDRSHPAVGRKETIGKWSILVGRVGVEPTAR